MFNFWHTSKKSPAILEPVASANRQRLNKAGIIVTKELEEAIERCRHKVQRIAKDCRMHNRRFRDPEFDFLDDGDKCLHGLPSPNNSLPTVYSPSDVLRVNEIFENPKFFIGGATESDISQGAIGNCWFLSGLSLIATAGLIEKICVERDEQVGVYGFIFWRDAGWVEVIIDDLLFVKIPKWREVDGYTRAVFKNDQDAYHKQARKGNKILYFGKSATENETWVPLLEKAYAKLHGDYAALEGGLTHEAVEDLSGAVSNWMYIRDTLDPERFWNEELLKANRDRLFACSIIDGYAVNDDGGRWSNDPLNGLVAQHAYSVIKAIEHKGVKFVRIRNPWGDYEWKGRWSDGSKEWTGEWLEALKELNYSFGNDGEFLMEYSDFLNAWDSVERCRLFDENWALSQLWLQVSLGEHPRPTNFGDVSFTINLSKPTTAVVMLSQLDTRYFLGVENPYTFSLRFLIFRHGEKEPIASSFYDSLWRRSVNVELDLEAGDYVVHVKIDRLPPYSPPPPAPDPIDPSLPAPAPPAPTASSTPPLDSRKKIQKKTELLIGASVAANFRPSDYGVQMPLPEDLYRGVDLTSMELAMYDLQSQFNGEKKAAFASKDKDVEKKDNASEKDGGAVEDKKVGERSLVNGEDEKDEKNGDKAVSSPTPSKENKDEHSEAQVGPQTESNPNPGPGPVQIPNPEGLESSGPPGPPDDLHEGYNCDGHKGSVTGSRFHCLDIACPDYDLCENCMKMGVHDPEHQMLEIKEPDRELIDNITALPTSNDVITVGLKVYASKECEVSIKGQLRHKDLIRNYVTMSRII